MFTDRKKLFRTALLGSTATFAGGAVLGASGVALAQDQDQEAAETIVITGSRIPRQDLVANSPVAVVGAEEFALTGNVQVENLLNDLPQVVPGLTTVNNNPGGAGSTVDLRGLGVNRTLVLVNGRRWLPSNLAAFTDVQTIPSGMVERVEVVTGGAAAVYGSDAIAGVINFILKDDFEGLSANAQYDIHSKGDGERIYVDATMGSNFADGRGNVMVNVSWFKQNPIFQGDRQLSAVPCSQTGTSTTTTPFSSEPSASGLCGPLTSAGANSNNLLFFGSSTIPQGVIQGAIQNGGAGVFGESLMFSDDGSLFGEHDDGAVCVPGAITGPNGGGDCNYNYAPPNYLQLPLTRTTINLSGHYDINDDIEFFMNASFVNIDIATRLAPVPAVTTVNFHTSNPFLFGVDGTPGNADRLVNQLANAACSRFGGAVTAPTGLNTTTPVVTPNTCGTWHLKQSGTNAGQYTATPTEDGSNLILATSGGRTTFVSGTATPTAFTFFSRLNGTKARAWIRNNNNGNMGFRIQRRMIEVGARENPIDDDLYQFTVGFRGQFANGWSWETYYQYAKFRRQDSVRNDVHAIRFAQAADSRADLDTNGNPITDANGNFVNHRCNIPPQQEVASKNAPCVPLTFFGLGALTPAMVNWIALDATKETEFEREMFGFNLAGNLVELPAGPMGFALGIEARRESGRFSPDDAFANGLTLGFNAVEPTLGRINVWEVYGETLIPLVTDAPLIKYLALEAGARWSHYSTSVGSVWTYKLGGEWRPFDDLKIRGLFQRAVRAPNISELFGGRGQGFPTYNDPCNGPNNTGTPTFTACQVWFGAASGLVTPGFTQNNSQLEAFFNSNPNLIEETANTWTVGGVFTPSQIPNLEIIVDYYSIVLKGGVGNKFGGTTSIINQCFAALLANPSPATLTQVEQCQRAPRNQQTGELTVENTVANLSQLTAKGLDAQVRYNFDLEDAIGLPGTMGIEVLYTHVFEQGVAATAGSPIFDCSGTFGAPFLAACPGLTFAIPDNKIAARATWRTGAYAVSLRWTMVGSLDNALAVYGYFPASIGAEHVLDITFQWDINDTVTLTLGVENVTNNKAPFLGFLGTEGNTDPQTFNAQVLGPRFFGRVSANF